MQRFYRENLQEEFFVDDKIFINQILKVLRWKLWEKYIFFDWKIQKDFIYKLSKIEKNKIFFKKETEISKNVEINFCLNVFCALPNKIEKIELICQKLTEIWVSKIIFFKAQRSQKIFLNDNKIDRIKKIIVEATEQSFRNFVPEFEILDNLDLQKINWQKIFFHTKNENAKLLKNMDFEEEINIFVWPEWWFYGLEVQNFEKNNFERVYFGDRILRMETSAITSAFYIVQNK